MKDNKSILHIIIRALPLFAVMGIKMFELLGPVSIPENLSGTNLIYSTKKHKLMRVLLHIV
ncbi:MAG: hypothetical protein A2V64_02695 [Bacteroidetes bacterium RBG_13_43_22]|nr:MAG: hypothetical protein A2V64_02695 [Bacteroidetes bacterium RBG_13_43_22]